MATEATAMGEAMEAMATGEARQSSASNNSPPLQGGSTPSVCPPPRRDRKGFADFFH
jgi:hypothetical protein